MRIALPVWEGRISPVFDTAGRLVIVDAEAGEEPQRREVDLVEPFPPRRAAKLVELGVEVLICGAISRPMASMVASYGVRVLPFVSGDAEDVFSAYLSGKLGEAAFPPRFRMPGCRRGFDRGRGRGRHGRRWWQEGG